jgi:DnaK suppressor protein
MATAKKKSSSKKAAAKKTTAKKKLVKKAAPKKKVAAKKSTAKKKAPVKKATVKKVAAKKKAPAKKAVSKKATTKKKAPTKKAAVKKAPAKKKVSKKVAEIPKSKTVKPTKAKTATAKKKAAPKSRGTMAMAVKNPTAHATPVEGFVTYKLRSGEEYMNDEQIQHFRDLLRAWKIELMQEVDRTVHHMQDEAANFPDPNDRATQESEFSLELRTRDRERKLIKKIDESFALLDTGEYGYCESCGIEIGVRRLEARPTATQCIDCKTLDEIREKQRG